MRTNKSRRKALTQVGAVAIAVPMMMVSQSASAAKVDAMRSALKYQAEPKGDQQCTGCIHYKGEMDKGGKGTCAIIPGDTEIDATGWCSGFAKKQ